MAEHHLPPEPANQHGGKGVHADDLKPASRRRYINYGYLGNADPLRTLCFVLLVLLLLVGITALVLYIVYRPTRPAFAVTSVGVYSLYNATSPSAWTAAGAGTGPPPAALTASFQVTLVIRNPNDRSAARYDRLTAYVAYRGEAITAPAMMPPLVQEPESAVVVAPVIGGGVAAPVPVSPDTAAALTTDMSYGVVPLRVVVLGRVRFLSGPFRSGCHSMYARCDLLVGVRKGAAGGAAVVPEAPLLSNPTCDVDM